MGKGPKKPWLAQVAESLSKAKINRAKAANIKYQGKAVYVKAKQSTSRLNAISRGAIGVAAAIGASKQNSNANQALAEWAKAIGSSSTPAEGTGESSTGSATTESTGDSSTTTGNNQPLGNYRGR